MWFKDILIALGIVGAIGLLAALLLALVSHFFHVPEDERAKRLREALPGVNCGACGYKGCDDYAAALAEGTAKANLCVPGAQDTAQMLSEILGIVVEPPKNMVAFVHCNGNCEATAKRNVYVGVESCRAAASLYGGPNACAYGCLGYGDCAKACPSHAICIKDGIAHVDATLCLGCGVCVDLCPKRMIELVPEDTAEVVMCNNRDRGADARKACSNACIGCKKCEKNCPANAITVVDALAKIDYEKCTRCGACVEGCPTGCLKKVSFPPRGEA